MKIALYTLYGNKGSSPGEVQDWMEEDKDYTRVSEIVDVAFPMLPEEVVVPLKVKSIEAQIAKVREEAAMKVAGLEEKKSKLLAITQQA